MPFAQHGADPRAEARPRPAQGDPALVGACGGGSAKCINLTRLAKATTTFEGGMRYAAWKVERHTGLPVKVTPLREKFPLIAAPGVLWLLWKSRRAHKPVA